jgi:uracil-DNA glycosylase
MKINRKLACASFPCGDVRHESHWIPDIAVKPEKMTILMISEAAPADPADYYYAKGDPLFARTTVQAFRDAGAEVASMKDVMDLGVYLTTAVKCGKTAYGIQSDTVRECSILLEREIALFPGIRAIMMMGDVAIKAVNCIAKRKGWERVIPAGSTYKIRGQKYFFNGIRAFPSYLQAGPGFFIEKSKRRMIAEDIALALRLAT